MSQWQCRGQRATCSSHFLPSAMCFPGIKHITGSKYSHTPSLLAAPHFSAFKDVQRYNISLISCVIISVWNIVGPTMEKQKYTLSKISSPIILSSFRDFYRH